MGVGRRGSWRAVINNGFAKEGSCWIDLEHCEHSFNYGHWSVSVHSRRFEHWSQGMARYHCFRDINNYSVSAITS